MNQHVSCDLWKIPPHTGERTKGEKANNVILSHYENSFDLANLPEASRGLPNIPGTHFENSRSVLELR